MIELDRLFDECKGANSYIRINSTHPVDIYIGYNSDVSKSMVIVGKNSNKTVKSTNSIDARLTHRNDGNSSLEFSLLEERYSTAFYKLCEDLISNTEQITADKVIYHSIKRWNMWRALFNNKSSDILGKESIKGLIGELLFLKYHMFKEYGVSRSIEAWRGPLGNSKDYLIDETWFEIKTISESKQSVGISSLEQLDSEVVGILIVIRLANTSNQVKEYLELNALVASIVNLIEDIEDLNGFVKRLDEVGYKYNIEYNEYCYEYKTTNYYKVDSEFPVIKRNILSNSIVKVSYELSLVDLMAERMEKWK